MTAEINAQELPNFEEIKQKVTKTQSNLVYAQMTEKDR